MSTRDTFQVLLRKKETESCARYSTIFFAGKDPYFYDTGTQKVFHLTEEEKDFFTHFLEDDPKKFQVYCSGLSDDLCESLANNISDYHLLQMPHSYTLSVYHHEHCLDDAVHHHLEQLILELTQRCNLRCRYCIYQEDYPYNRNYSNSDMTEEMALRAVDYAFEHAQDELAITFYGGEPLLQFPLLQKVVEYARQKKSGKKLSFSVTSNMTLMTEEMADFIARIPEFSLLCSIDGPQEIHDAYHIDVKGEGSFSRAIKGLQIISAAYKKYRKENLGINAVFAPPFTIEKIEQIHLFFQSLDLPPHTRIDLSYAQEESLPEEKRPIDTTPEKQEKRQVNPLWNWSVQNYEEYGMDPDHITINWSNMTKSLNTIHRRALTDEPAPACKFNGCCVPASRRLYVSTTGAFKVCERIGEAPDFGNITSGIDLEKLKRAYVDEYAQISGPDCDNCWAQKLCMICYASCYSKSGIDINRKRKTCKYEKRRIHKTLSLYYELLQRHPELIHKLNKLETI